MNPITALLALLGLYALAGFVFAVPFVLVGVRRIDPVASHAPLRVRLLFLPGAAALWPAMLRRWRRSGTAVKP